MAAQQPQGPPQIVHPLNEPRPELDYCLTDQPAGLVPEDSSVLIQGTIDIVRARDPQQAYLIDGDIMPKNLIPGVPGWGDMFFAKVLLRLPDGAYQLPSQAQCKRVAIKCLNKKAVEKEQMAGSRKDPYREILRMRTIENNVNVLDCIEALQDNVNMYIVMPYCEDDSLLMSVPRGVGLSEDRARIVFEQIRENLQYLRGQRICHRDLSPDNCLMYQGRPVFSDFARSFQLPPVSSHVHGTNPHGKPAYQPPEVLEVYRIMHMCATCGRRWSPFSIY
jgi:serine/threonine protein kinase